VKEKNKYLLGLTGGIGTGKSTVLEMLAKKGAATIDADAIVHGLYADDSTLRNALAREFGDTVIKEDNTVDRKALAEIVFDSARERKRLEELIHPRVRRKIKAELQQTQMPIIVVDIPLLYENWWQDEFDAVVVVNANDETRLARLVKRGMTRIESRKRIDAQMPMVIKLRKANFVINNGGTRAETQRQVDRLWQKILEAHHGG
jgi:dephospho-CoA kinase